MKDCERKIHLKDCSVTKNGVRHRYFSLAESRKVDGKNQKTTIRYLGNITEAQEESYRCALKSINSGKGSIVDLEDLRYERSYEFLNVAVMHCLWQQLGFSKIFSRCDGSHKEVSTEQVAEILVTAKLLKPSSNVRTVEWCNESTLLPKLMGNSPGKYNRMKIFHELSTLAACRPNMEEHFLGLAQKYNSDGFDIFFIDGTTTYFEGTECELARPGKDKTTGFQTHIVLILLVTDRQGYPCAWEVYEGNDKEVKRLKEIAQRICTQYKITNITFCFDRGFASMKNFEMIEDLQSKFISGLDRNQISQVCDVALFQNTTRQKILDNAATLHQFATPTKGEASKRRWPIDGFYTADGERYYRDLGVKSLLGGHYRYVAGFSTDIYQAEQAHREQARLDAFLKICELNEELAAAKKDRDLDVAARKVSDILEAHKMQGIIQFTLTPTSVKVGNDTIQSGVIKYSVDSEAWHQAQLLDGLFVYVTDHSEVDAVGMFKLTAYDITRHYKDKFVIEQDFRGLKNIIDLRPLYVRLPEHVRALVSISMMAQFINVFITRRLATIGMSLNEFYNLLDQSKSVAVLSTPKRTLNKLVKTQPRLITALEALDLKDSVFSDRTMATLA
ncbi:IS1634 family transposase [Bdellovibrionota bacterium FG-2]